jgi:sugar O-acyltransferase (sialic acid O-acetyltransferase NeuD family)
MLRASRLSGRRREVVPLLRSQSPPDDRPAPVSGVLNHMAEPLVIFGNGQMAELALARFRREGRYVPVGFTVDRSFVREGELCGLPVVPFEEVEAAFSPAAARMFIAVGPVQINSVSADRFMRARALGYRFASCISPDAIVDPGVVIGENCSIGEHAVIGPAAHLGDNVRIGTASVIGHHCVLEDHCFVGINCSVSGSVRIGTRALVGAGAVIRDRINIGRESIVGVGATIVRDTAPESVHVAPEAVELPISSRRMRL